MIKESIVTVSDSAKLYIKNMLQKRGKDSLGIRIKIGVSQCGISYIVEYADVQSELDYIIVLDTNVKLIFNKEAIAFLIGTKIDYIETSCSSGLKFTNPNEKGRCNCGKKIRV